MTSLVDEMLGNVFETTAERDWSNGIGHHESTNHGGGLLPLPALAYNDVNYAMADHQQQQHHHHQQVGLYKLNPVDP